MLVRDDDLETGMPWSRHQAEHGVPTSMTNQRSCRSGVAALGLGVMALAAAGCLPRGEPPTGQQLLSDPTAALLSLIRGPGDGTKQVLFFRPSQDQNPDLVDLWSISVDANGAPSTERMLMAGISSGLELSYRPSAGSIGFPIDARGRVYVFADRGDSLFRIDPATGDRQPVGDADFPLLSPSGRRVLTHGKQGQYTLYEADDQALPLEGYQAQFLDEILLYLSPDCSLMRVVAGGGPEQIIAGVASFFPLSGSMMLVRKTAAGACDPAGFAGSSAGAQVLLDTATLQETSLPDTLQVTGPRSISSDGRWLIGYLFDPVTRQSHSVVVDLTTGARRILLQHLRPSRLALHRRVPA